MADYIQCACKVHAPSILAREVGIQLNEVGKHVQVRVQEIMVATNDAWHTAKCVG